MSTEYMGVKATATPGAPHNPDFENADDWTVRLSYQGRRMQVPFYKGHGHNGAEPTAHEVLEALLSDASSVEDGDFENWCAELGYDTDSRKAERTYKVCESIEKRLRHLLGDDYATFMYYTRE